MQNAQPSELYPVGTNVYDGVTFQKGYIFDTETGEAQTTTNANALSGYIPVSELYQYTRSYRLYKVGNYDENYNYLGYQDGVSDTNTSVISSFVSGTKYIRTIINKSYVNDNGLVSQSACWLKRTA